MTTPDEITPAQMLDSLDPAMWADIAPHLTDHEADTIADALTAMGLHQAARILTENHTP